MRLDSSLLRLSRCLFNSRNKLVCQERPVKSGRIFTLDIPAFVVISASGQGAEYWRAGRRRKGICESRCVFGRTACLHVRRKKSVIGVMHFFVLVALVPVLFWREFVYFFKHFNKSAGTGKTTFF